MQPSGGLPPGNGIVASPGRLGRDPGPHRAVRKLTDEGSEADGRSSHKGAPSHRRGSRPGPGVGSSGICPAVGNGGGMGGTASGSGPITRSEGSNAAGSPSSNSITPIRCRGFPLWRVGGGRGRWIATRNTRTFPLAGEFSNPVDPLEGLREKPGFLKRCVIIAPHPRGRRSGHPMERRGLIQAVSSTPKGPRCAKVSGHRLMTTLLCECDRDAHGASDR